MLAPSSHRGGTTAREKTRDYLQALPAHRDIALYQVLSPGADFPFVDLAQWCCAAEFTEAVSSPGFRDARAGLRRRFHPAPLRVARAQAIST